MKHKPDCIGGCATCNMWGSCLAGIGDDFFEFASQEELISRFNDANVCDTYKLQIANGLKEHYGYEIEIPESFKPVTPVVRDYPGIEKDYEGDTPGYPLLKADRKYTGIITGGPPTPEEMEEYNKYKMQEYKESLTNPEKQTRKFVRGKTTLGRITAGICPNEKCSHACIYPEGMCTECYQLIKWFDE